MRRSVDSSSGLLLGTSAPAATASGGYYSLAPTLSSGQLALSSYGTTRGGAGGGSGGGAARGSSGLQELTIVGASVAGSGGGGGLGGPSIGGGGVGSPMRSRSLASALAAGGGRSMTKGRFD